MIVAIIGILVAMAIPLYVTLQVRARVAKAETDVQTLVSSVARYSAHMGRLPAALSALNSVATNSLGQTAGPFMSFTPDPPVGWSAYVYSTTPAGTFTIWAAGDNSTVSLP